MQAALLGPLVARHLRFYRDLLALSRHTLDPASTRCPARWPAWMREREGLVARLEAHDPARLASETAAVLDRCGRTDDDLPEWHQAAAYCLRRLHAGEMAAMHRLTNHERALAKAMGEAIARARDRLLSGERSRLACLQSRQASDRSSRGDRGPTAPGSQA